jgi:hypothetical protein
MPRRRKSQPEPTQLSQPKGRDKDGKPYEPVEIPVPSEADVFGDLEKLARKPGKNTGNQTDKQERS